jgi:hypothetical protein
MKQLSQNDVVNILNFTFNFEIVETPIGKGVIMSDYDAFVFSTITGAGYMENKIFPYTPKGHMKVFQHALETKFVTGLLENYTFRTSPIYLSEIRPYLFSGKKTMIPVEFENEIILRKKLDLLSEKENPSYLIMRLETYKKGNGLEPFLEYLACRYFNDLGYVTENQIPLFPTVGSPDFAGFRLYNGFELSGLGLFKTGFNVIELSLIRLFQSDGVEQLPNDTPHLIVGEAKTSTTNISKQLQKYIDTDLFNESMEIFPFHQSSGLNSSFHIGTDYKLYYTRKSSHKVNIAKQHLYLEWLKNYFKYYLLSNLKNDEFREYFYSVTNESYDDKIKLLRFVEQISISQLLLDLKKYFKYGTFQ